MMVATLGNDSIAADISRTWTIKKRSGQSMAFDVGRITRALERCFTTLNRDYQLIPVLVRRVVNSLARTGSRNFTVEQVQDSVISHLWGEGLRAEAEHYTDYRKQHDLLRAQRPIDPETRARFDQLSRDFPSPLQAYMFLSKFARWNGTRRETWYEAVHDRVMPWLRKVVTTEVTADALTEDEWTFLTRMMYQFKASPAMRVLQLAGPALDRCMVGVFNCAYMPILDLASFSEFLYVLMQGTGAGFNVEYQVVGQLPIVSARKDSEVKYCVIPDTTEGWCDALRLGLESWYAGNDVFFDYSQIRPAGASLKTKGGRASGPEPLRELLTFARTVIFANQGRRLSDVDVHRICCFIGRIVQVGGVRRAATISLSDLNSAGMRDLKSGAWWQGNEYWSDSKYLSMANNSSVYNGRPSFSVFVNEWSALIRSNSGERGIFNRDAVRRNIPARRKYVDNFGVNPCGEIVLRPFQFCNLTIAVAREDDTRESLFEKVKAATYFGVIQSLCTRFRYIRDKWRENTCEERLLGVDITGHADCPLLRFGAPGRAELLRELRDYSVELALELAARFNINAPAAVTTVKPSGDSALFFGCASGVSPRFAAYQIRRVRETKDSPIAKLLLAAGVPHEPAAEAPDRLLAFNFLLKPPPGATLRDEMTALDQLENWLEWSQNYAEHNVSATIYAQDDEWFDAGAWVYRNFDRIGGLSFLPRDNGSYSTAPNEEITAEKYAELSAVFPEIDWAELVRYETEDHTESSQTFACTAGGCETSR